MTEATEKQVSFAKSLKIDNPSQYSKEALKELISVKLEGDNPKPKVETVIPAEKPDKEYHWSPEQVNSKALEAAINTQHGALISISDLLTKANVFVKYIMGNGYIA